MEINVGKKPENIDKVPYSEKDEEYRQKYLNKIKTEIPKISTGEPSTLKTYRMIALIMSGNDENSTVVKFFDNKIKEQGEDAVVIADESQMMFLIGKLVLEDVDKIETEK